VDVHGQSEHFFLLKESNQLKTLDNVAGKALLPLKEELSSLLKQKKCVQEQIAMLGGDEQERSRRLDILSFQIEELEGADLKEGEEEELLLKRAKIMNMEKIVAALREAMQAISGEGGVSDGLRYASRAMLGIARIDENYAALCDKIEGVASEAEDVLETLSDMADGLDFDENEAEETETRLDLIRGLKRKYGASKAEIDDYLHAIQEEYETLSDCEGQLTALKIKKEKISSRIFTLCLELTKLRKREGNAFCARVIEQLKTLNIPHAQFYIQFNDYTVEDVDRANLNGLDGISFAFSANAGEPAKPLGKIISGGEMSRFMLAIKTQLSSINEICSYIFDEIDAGISGITAKVVGEKLAQIARKTQIIAVSHLPQIAAMSDNEFLIEKQEGAEKTITTVIPLDEEGKKRELVRLLGGDNSGGYALKHAEELLLQAKTYKSSII
jgi:DNA repair protein RecN (Recombination protein N)